MRMPDLLATRAGRMTAFFFLYMTEGIPLGFTATAIATQMRRGGLGPAEIGAFVGSLYLPWAFKWAAGPFVDVIHSRRFGRRRGWILLTQLMMVLALLCAVPVDFVSQLSLFTAIIFVHNMFCAVQDVAIDALACNVLPEDERGTANGFMFGGAYLGQALGGGGVLFLVPHIGFKAAFFVVSAYILCVTVFIALPLRENAEPEPAPGEGLGLARVGREIGGFAKDAFSSFISSRAAFVGVILALLPQGAMAFGLSLQSNLAVELGLKDTQIGTLSLWSSLIGGLACVAGGWLSDRFGRRMVLALTMGATVLPTAIYGWLMYQHHWIMPVALDAPNRTAPAASLVLAFWVCALVYALFQGLYYGVKSALFMDVTNPRVAATQFTAYMALNNLAISYSATWLGFAARSWGYPMTLMVDCIAGLLFLGCLPFMGKKAAEIPAPAGKS